MSGVSGTPMSDEERVIRDWLNGQLSPSGSPLPPSRRTSQPLPRRQVTAVVATLIDLLDEARAHSGEDDEPVTADPSGTFTATDIPVVDGVATLPDGQTVASESEVVRIVGFIPAGMR